jgi:hypothetical protein
VKKERNGVKGSERNERNEKDQVGMKGTEWSKGENKK